MCEDVTLSGVRGFLRKPLSLLAMNASLEKRASMEGTLSAHPLKPAHELAKAHEHQLFVLFSLTLQPWFEMLKKHCVHDL